MANEQNANNLEKMTVIGNGTYGNSTYNTSTYPSGQDKNSATSTNKNISTSTALSSSNNIGTYTFGADYFAGQNVKIFFGDIFVDEISEMSFSLSEQVAPIYGYASYTWDAVARGTRLIQGSFSINFKESSYLYLTLNELTKTLRKNITKVEGEQSDNLFDLNNFKKNITIEQALSGKGNYKEKTTNFEKALWGEASQDYEYMERNNYRPKDTHFYPNFINAEKTMSSDKTVYYDSSQRELRENGFNILISYGGLDQNCFGDGSTAHTLVNVQLTGVQQVIDGSDNPIQEVYTFIAKDLDGNVKIKY